MSGNPSLEPYLRARNVDPTLIPSNPPRGLRKTSHVQVQETDFTDFLQHLVTLAVSPSAHTLASPLVADHLVLT